MKKDSFVISYRKLNSFLNSKRISIIVLLVVLVSFLPLFYLAPYVHAAGDDYGYGAPTRAVWLETKSLIEVFKTAIIEVKGVYRSWQGTWFSVFLFSLQPEVFHHEGYIIVPFLLIGSFILGSSYFLYCIFVKILKFNKSQYIILTGIYLFLGAQFIPRTRSAFFWYNGGVHYMLPHAIALISICFALKYIKNSRTLYLLLASIGCALLGGSNYLSALLAWIGIFYLFVYSVYNKSSKWWLIGPLTVETIGLVVSALSPGNKARGGEEFGFSITKIFATIWQAIDLGMETAIGWVVEKPLIVVGLLIAAIFAWEAVSSMEVNIKFEHPLIFVIFMTGIYFAMFAPEVYAGVEVSGGVPNNEFLVFLLIIYLNLIYCMGWIYEKIFVKKERDKKESLLKYQMYIKIPMIILLMLLTVMFRRGIKDTVAYECYDFVVSGTLEDYNTQMNARLKVLLDDSIKEAVLPQMYPEWGPFMHMEILTDEEAWTNTVVAQFYQKDSVLGIAK